MLVYVHMCVHTCVRMSRYVSGYMCLGKRMCVHMHVRACVYACVSDHVHVCVSCTQMCKCMCV